MVNSTSVTHLITTSSNLLKESAQSKLSFPVSSFMSCNRIARASIRGLLRIVWRPRTKGQTERTAHVRGPENEQCWLSASRAVFSHLLIPRPHGFRWQAGGEWSGADTQSGCQQAYLLLNTCMFVYKCTGGFKGKGRLHSVLKELLQNDFSSVFSAESKL